jgi:hypothetical protein
MVFLLILGALVLCLALTVGLILWRGIEHMPDEYGKDYLKGKKEEEDD